MKSFFYRLVIIVGFAFVGACQPAQENFLIVEGPMLGTRMRVVAQLRDVNRQEVFQKAMQLDKEMKHSMSIFEADSRLNRLNKNLTDTVDEHIRFNLNLAREIASQSDGYYDVTLKPLVEAWGFAGRDAMREPNVDSLLEFVGMDKVRIENMRLVKEDERVQLDFNSIAKGYTVDKLAELLEEMGSVNYLVDIGGEIRSRGKNSQGKPWRIGVETPFEGNMTDGEYLQKRIAMTDGGMATSGNYRRFYLTKEGQRVTHTLDPHTGRSATSRLLSVTVVAKTCAEADALGTMFLAMGAERAMAKIQTMPEIAAYFILATDEATNAADAQSAFEEYVSPKMQKLIME